VLLIAIALTLCFDLLKPENIEGEIAGNAQDMPPQVMTQAINDGDLSIFRLSFWVAVILVRKTI
jgi:hypothetical protein